MLTPQNIKLVKNSILAIRIRNLFTVTAKTDKLAVDKVQ